MADFDSKTGKNAKKSQRVQKKQNKIFNLSSLLYETHF